MNEVVNVSLLTPIEIALQIDENGHTTARALYIIIHLSRNMSKSSILQITLLPLTL